MATDNKDDIIIAILEEMKSGMKNQKQPQIDLSKIETLSGKLENSINATSDCMIRIEDIVEEVRKPVIRERKITIDIIAKEVVFLFIGMGLLISMMGSALYFVSRPNYDREDNDLKYRYIKMKGEATPNRISELENLFEINRDNAKIRQLRQDVEDYERAVREKAALDEQARLRQLQADKLNQQVNSIKNK
ncbi:MAG: hypothetical protein RR302_04970 [Victivallaceae bacterium]